MPFGSEGESSKASPNRGTPNTTARLVLEHASMLHRLISRQFQHDPDLVKDLEQEVWYRVLTGIARRPEPDREAAWLAGIARHVCVDAIRARQRRTRLASTVSSLSRDEATEIMRRADDTLDDLDRRRIAGAVAALPPRVRDVAIARYYHDREPHEIATEFGMSPNAVYKALSVARRLLRSLLGGLAAKEGIVSNRGREGGREGGNGALESTVRTRRQCGGT